jgi:hypothetical protein
LAFAVSTSTALAATISVALIAAGPIATRYPGRRHRPFHFLGLPQRQGPGRGGDGGRRS